MEYRVVFSLFPDGSEMNSPEAYENPKNFEAGRITSTYFYLVTDYSSIYVDVVADRKADAIRKARMKLEI